MPPTRSMNFFRPRPPSCFSERWLWRLWQPPCCTDPHSPVSASSARIWRQCWSHPRSRITGRSTFTSPSSLPGLDLFLLTVTAALGAHVFHVLAGFALAATFLVANLLYGPRTAPSQMDRLSNLALSIYLVVATLLVLASRHDPAALIAFVVLTAATVGIAWRTEAATPSVVVATVLAAVVMAHWAVHERLDALIARTTRPLPYRIVAALTSVILALFYFTLEVRRLFHGPALAGITSDAEQYT